MTRNVLRSMLAIAMLGSAFVALSPTANAQIPPPCGGVHLPLWDYATCMVAYGVDVTRSLYTFTTCDVVGGPACTLCPDLQCLVETLA